MRSLFLYISLLLGLQSTACATLSGKKFQFNSNMEAEAYLKKHKTCPGCDLRRAELSYTDLRGADHHGAILVRADLLTAPKLEGADLRDTDLTEANVLNHRDSKNCPSSKGISGSKFTEQIAAASAR